MIENYVRKIFTAFAGDEEIRLAIGASYLIASVLFILGLKFLNSPRTARRGMFLAEAGMALAVIATLLDHEVVSLEWILLGLFLGSVAGYIIAMLTPMTAMPQRTALSHAFGALAAALVGVTKYYTGHVKPDDHGLMIALGFEVLLGALTFTGSMVAFGKLQGLLPGAPIQYKGQNFINITTIFALVASFGYLIYRPDAATLFYVLAAIALVFGVSLVLPIGAADMPVVMSLLNAYAGLAGSATGFALNNNVLIIAGALDGASGVILSIIMTKAMNRSLTNVLFGGFGAPIADAGTREVKGTIKSQSAEEAAAILDVADSVIFVPGYGMAVSQAQHSCKKLVDYLIKKGKNVRFAIHPVAGRMPGHMNVLLAEAGVDYDLLYDMDAINDDFATTDVSIVIGANDVVNPAAKEDKSSPIYGMPILNVDASRTVIVLKRSMNPGFSGIENELFYKDNCIMVFGDAKKTLEEFVSALQELDA
ncbi:MAG: NAD(P)(+) transhydrogenase (Re/Si-specific) subunit beta [Leptospiraceae bacterium]|nr:NAD(P)(+) transhydrogenase (Re/Si-specific) subunit beta [Leptospiraceae bacterium]